MKTLINGSCVCAVRLPGWGLRDPSKFALKTIDDIAQCLSGVLGFEGFVLLYSSSAYYFSFELSLFSVLFLFEQKMG